MKKTHIFGLIAFLSGVAATIAGIAYYLNKKNKEAEDYEDMLYNEDYLSDYMPKHEEGCCCGEKEPDEEACEESCCCENGCCEEPTEKTEE